jgi:hypothetical protein
VSFVIVDSSSRKLYTLWNSTKNFRSFPSFLVFQRRDCYVVATTLFVLPYLQHIDLQRGSPEIGTFLNLVYYLVTKRYEMAKKTYKTGRFRCIGP